MKIIKSLILTLMLFVVIGGTWFYFEHSLPSENIIKKEFLQQNSDLKNIEIVGVELTMTEARLVEKDVLTYLIKFKNPEDNEVKIGEFSVKQHRNFQWHWCDDQTQRKCDSESN